MSNWNPIDENTPRDEKTPILVCCPGMSNAWFVRWREGPRKKGWFSGSGFIMFEPTLWAEVPKPPEKEV